MQPATDATVLADMSTMVGSLAVDAGDTVSIDDGMAFQITAGPISNAGNIVVGDGVGALLKIRSSTVLDGGGTVTLSGTGATFRAHNSGQVLENRDNTIRGRGRFGNNWFRLENNGTVDADIAGELLTVDPSTSGALNSGTMRASGGGVLALVDGGYENAGGAIEALAGSFVELRGADIRGGTLSTAGDGAILGYGTGSPFSMLTGAPGALTNQGAFVVQDGQEVRIRGAIVNAGTISVTGSNNPTFLTLNGNLLLSGGGTVTLTDAGNSRIRAVNSGQTLDNRDNTIQGAGLLGDDWLRIENHGIVDANVPGQSLTVDPSTSGAENRGYLRASANGVLVLNSATYDNSSGVIQARKGCTVKLDGAHILGGVLDTVGAGVIQGHGFQDKSCVLNGAVSVLTNAGQFVVVDGEETRIRGTIANTGHIAVEGASSRTALTLSGNLDLNGGGTLMLTGGSNAVVDALVSSQVLRSHDNTIAGNGVIEAKTDLSGNLSPGAGIGLLTFEKLNILAGASYDFDIDGGSSDSVEIVGTGTAFTMDHDGPYAVNVNVTGGTNALGRHVMFHWVGKDPLTYKEWGFLYRHTDIVVTPGYEGNWSYHTNENEIAFTVLKHGVDMVSVDVKSNAVDVGIANLKPGTFYTMEHATSLCPPVSWSPAGAFTAATTFTTWTDTFTNQHSSAFYRLLSE